MAAVYFIEFGMGNENEKKALVLDNDHFGMRPDAVVIRLVGWLYDFAQLYADG